jgi:hypothetical protein
MRRPSSNASTGRPPATPCPSSFPSLPRASTGATGQPGAVADFWGWRTGLPFASRALLL